MLYRNVIAALTAYPRLDAAPARLGGVAALFAALPGGECSTAAAPLAVGESFGVHPRVLVLVVCHRWRWQRGHDGVKRDSRRALELSQKRIQP